MIYTIKNSEAAAMINTVGAEVISLTLADGTRLLHLGDKAFKHSSPLLFPICGRLKDGVYTTGGATYALPLHGFLSAARFSLMENTGERLHLSFSDTDETRAAYPFGFRVDVCHELIGKKLRTTVSVTNTGDGVLPFMFGGHPAFLLPNEAGLSFDDYELRTPGRDRVFLFPLTPGSFVSETPEKCALPGEKFAIKEAEILARDTTVFSGMPATVTLAAKGGTLAVSLTRSANLPFLLLWRSADPKADFLCVEPWSGVPQDGTKPENFDTRGSMRRLSPQESESFFYEIEWNKKST